MEEYSFRSVRADRIPLNARAVLRAVERYDHPFQPVDDNLLSQCLQNRLEGDEVETLLQSINTPDVEGKQKTMFLIFKLLKYLPMPDTINLLVDVGYNQLASILKLEYFGYPRDIPVGCTRNLKKIRNFWFTLKKQSDNKSFKDASAFFSSLAGTCRREIDTAEHKQKFVDRLAIISWFQVQQYDERGCTDRRSILENMRSSVPAEADRSLIEIVYHSKMTTTLEFEDKLEEASDMGSKAKYLSEVFNDNSAKIMAHYSYFFFHRKLYLRDKTASNRRRAIEQCNIGCSMFVDADDEFEKFCYILFLLYRAGEYLQITYDLEVLDTYDFGKEDIKASEEVLDTVIGLLDYADPRRKLAFNLCMGRLHQIKKEYQKSIDHLRDARKLMRDGTLNEIEKDHIKSYYQRVVKDRMRTF